MQITHDIIKALNPCSNRFENFTLNYPNFIGDAANFLGLENITYEDKIWVMTRLLTKKENAKWGVKCAYSVLPIFEKEYPSDKRPRELLEFISAIKDFEHISSEDLSKLNKLQDATDATVADGTASYAAATCAAAGAATYAAASAAYSAASYAADAADVCAPAKKIQQDLNLKLLLEVLCG